MQCIIEREILKKNQALSKRGSLNIEPTNNQIMFKLVIGSINLGVIRIFAKYCIFEPDTAFDFSSDCINEIEYRLKNAAQDGLSTIDDVNQRILLLKKHLFF